MSAQHSPKAPNGTEILAQVYEQMEIWHKKGHEKYRRALVALETYVEYGESD